MNPLPHGYTPPFTREDRLLIDGDIYDVMDVFFDVDNTETMREYLAVELHVLESALLHPTHAVRIYTDTGEIFFVQYEPSTKRHIERSAIENVEKKEKE